MTRLVARKALLDYARRPLNLALLVAVPVVIVLALSGELAAFSKLLSTAKPLHLEAATAAWAAAAVAGLAGFFQAVASRRTDRRLAAASAFGARPVVGGRLVAAAALALAASAAALAALAMRGGIVDAPRAVTTVLLVAAAYVAIGVLVGTLVRSEMNGALVVSTIWMLDVFVGTGLGGGSSVVFRVFPLHFPTMILTGQVAHHAGPLSNLGWALLWTVGLTALAVARLSATTRPARHAALPAGATARPDAVARTEAPGSPLSRSVRLGTLTPFAARPPRAPATPTGAGVWAAVRQYRRDRVLWALLVAVPVLFIALAAGQTPTTPIPVAVVDGVRQATAILSLRQIHAGEMAAIASALLAGVAGLFVVTGSAGGDRRLVLAGFRPRQVLAGHLAVVAGAAVLTSAVSLTVSAAFFAPRLWPEYAGADLIIALTYATIGVLLGPIVGRLGGLYALLLLSMVDVGYGQTVMFHPLPPSWGAFLPARGASRLMLDGAFTGSFEQYASLALALAWLCALGAVAALTFRRQIGAVPQAVDGHLARPPATTRRRRPG